MPKAFKPIGRTFQPLTDAQHEAAKAARRQYLREWRKRNPELVRQQQERYWARKAERMAEGDNAVDTAE